MLTQSIHPVGSTKPSNSKANTPKNRTFATSLVVIKNQKTLSITRCISAATESIAPPPPRDIPSLSWSSRSCRAHAQKVLFDYLYCTRLLDFTDAEHMSKNCPFFLKNLVAQVQSKHERSSGGGGGGIARLSLASYLRYNPINEFEPFLESAGLKPDELQPLLPRDLMFLGDDTALLDNYRVLCNYGVPRSRIGRLYKDGREIFRYQCGVLMSKLRAYEELGLAKPTIIKLVTCCPSLLIGEIDVKFIAVVEKLKSLNIELDSIRGCFSDQSLYLWSRIIEMLNFLQTMGADKENLASLVRNHPKFVFDDSGKKVYVLAAMLWKLGLKMDAIITLFLQYPWILLGKSANNLYRSVNFLMEIEMEMPDILRILCSHPHVLSSCSCKSLADVLASLNLSAERLCEIIKEDPNHFSTLVSKSVADPADLPSVKGLFLKEKIDFLLKLGFVENSDEMEKAMSKFCGRGDQLQERFDCLVDTGLDYHTVVEMIKSVPNILRQSVYVIEKKIDYILNEMGYSLEELASFPASLTYKLEKIKLRFAMYKWLKDHGVAFHPKDKKMIAKRSLIPLSRILTCSDMKFVNTIVSQHPEGQEVWYRLKTLNSSD